MDNDIVKAVYESLESDTAEINNAIAERDALEGEIKEGRYSQATLQQEIFPKRDELRRKVSDDAARAIQKAKDLVNQYREDSEALNELDPSAITDDIKLLQAGVPLTARDINAILNRNADNRTMTQLALRYAREHGIETGTLYVGGEAERETAKSLDGIIDYYARWIEESNNIEMLNKFFSL